MKITVDLTFSIPIWRFFYENDDKYIIPYEFTYKDKKYKRQFTLKLYINTLFSNLLSIAY